MLRYKQRRNMKTSLKIVVVALLVGLIGFTSVFETYTFLNKTANAATTADASGPNVNWLSHAGRYTLENDANVQGAQVQVIPLYIENTGSKTDPETYPPSNVRMRASDFSRGYIGAVFSQARFIWCNGQTGFTRTTIEFIIPRTCFTYVPTLNVWTMNLRAELQNHSGLVMFRLDFVSPNNGHQLLGYSTANQNQGFAVGNRYRCDPGGDLTGCGRFYNYSIPFGVPCTITGRVEASASIFDGDNATGSQYGIQYNRLFSVGIYNVTTGSWVSIKRTVGGLGNNQLMTYYFDVVPENKYQFRVNDVYTNNVLQFRLPYNSIEYNNDCSWNLNPTVTVDPDTSEGASSDLDVDYFMPNSGASTSDPVRWQLSRCIVNVDTGSAAYSKVSDNTLDGVTTYNNLGANCQQVTSRTNQTIARGTVNQLGSLANQSIPDLAPGSRVCYVLSVNPPTDKSPTNRWRHSTPACVVIGKKPKVQIWGGDLFVGRQFAGVAGFPTSNVQTATTTKRIGGQSVKFGAWGEYAIAATGSINGLASGSAYAGGTNDLAACQVSLLTLANTQTTSPCGNGTVLGNYRTNRSIPDVAGAFTTSNSTPAVSGSISLTGRDGLYRATGNVTITGGTITQGQSVIINAQGRTVTITGNITYDGGSISRIEDIPQVIIIAENIRIRGANAGTAVSQVDAWLIARGTLNTCYDAGTATTLTINRCDTRLTVNGPVMAGNIQLWRTAGSGSGAAAGSPAEVFNLRPDAYLWGVWQASNSGRLESVYERELPPRF